MLLFAAASSAPLVAATSSALAASDRFSMPSSLKQLEILRRKSGNEDVPIDLELMSQWSAQQAMQYFQSGGTQTPSVVAAEAAQAVVVERMRTDAAEELLQRQPDNSTSKTAEVPSDEEEEVEFNPRQNMGIFAPTLAVEFQGEEEREWRTAYDKKNQGGASAALKDKRAGLAPLGTRAHHTTLRLEARPGAGGRPIGDDGIRVRPVVPYAKEVD